MEVRWIYLAYANPQYADFPGDFSLGATTIGKNRAKKGKFANCAGPSRFPPIKSVKLQTLSKYHPKIVRRKRKGRETRLRVLEYLDR